MKCFIAILLLALVAIAMAAKLPENRNIEPEQAQGANELRDKRGLLLGTYSSPLYPYVSPLSYNLPYAYSYPSYRLPYYYSPYIL